jgi:hypothetical protein
MLVDPDEGLELTEEMKNALRHSVKLVREGAPLYDVDEVSRRLGLEGIIVSCILSRRMKIS